MVGLPHRPCSSTGANARPPTPTGHPQRSDCQISSTSLLMGCHMVLAKLFSREVTMDSGSGWSPQVSLVALLPPGFSQLAGEKPCVVAVAGWGGALHYHWMMVAHCTRTTGGSGATRRLQLYRPPAKLGFEIPDTLGLTSLHLGYYSKAQLFWARIKDIKAILRYKNFQSAAPAQF